MKDPEKIRLGSRVRALRKKSGKTKQAVADHFDYTWDAINKWEKGDSSPPSAKLRKLADFLGVTVADFYKQPEHANTSWPYSEGAEDYAPYSEERAMFIQRAVFSEYGMVGLNFETIKGRDDYLAGEISDAGFYETIKKEIERMLDVIARHRK